MQARCGSKARSTSSRTATSCTSASRTRTNDDDEPTNFPTGFATTPKARFFNEEILKREVGIRFNGVEKTNVEEYCVSEGWIRVAAGNAKDRAGNAMTMKLRGKVEPFFKGEA